MNKTQICIQITSQQDNQIILEECYEKWNLMGYLQVLDSKTFER